MKEDEKNSSRIIGFFQVDENDGDLVLLQQPSIRHNMYIVWNFITRFLFC